MAEQSRKGAEGQRVLKVLVCGGRTYNDKKTFYKELDGLLFDRGHLDPEYSMPMNVHIIHGNAKGADTLADEYAVVNWTGLSVFKADWEKYGKAAGAIRNKQMLDEGQPDVVLAFPGGRGTAHMVSIARKAGVEVIEVPREAVTFPKTDRVEGRNFID